MLLGYLISGFVFTFSALVRCWSDNVVDSFQIVDIRYNHLTLYVPTMHVIPKLAAGPYCLLLPDFGGVDASKNMSGP